MERVWTPPVDETLQMRLERVLRDPVAIVPYDPAWPILFEQEKHVLTRLLAGLGLTGRIEHFGSTAVPGLAAKPVVDMLVEAENLERIRTLAPAILEANGYDTFWRPGDNTQPWYFWCIKRAPDGRRTHHIHEVEPGMPLWGNLAFRDALRAAPDLAASYRDLKLSLARRFPDDRIAYTGGKAAFIARTMADLQGKAARPCQPDGADLS